MAALKIKESLNVRRLLEEAEALMGLEAAARKVDVRKPDFAELQDFTLSNVGGLRKLPVSWLASMPAVYETM